jgi:hypothetical protein
MTEVLLETGTTPRSPLGSIHETIGASEATEQSMIPIGSLLQALKSRAKKNGTAGRSGEDFGETTTHCPEQAGPFPGSEEAERRKKRAPASPVTAA